MTIAISLKINDGLVLAADSASTVMSVLPGQEVANFLNVYNNANKIFNLHKGLPIGAITWGGGSIGSASIETIVKDLRYRFSGKKLGFEMWKLNKQTYTLEGVAESFRRFVYDELYKSASLSPDYKSAEIGFIVAGYSAAGDVAEEYSIVIKADGSCEGPSRIRPGSEVGVTWAGQPDALNRLLMGYSSNLPDILRGPLGVPPEHVAGILALITQSSQAQIIVAPMPLQDAVDLAEFLVDTTIKFTRFTPGTPTVGGPIEIAAISKHEGFRWIRRKHYFSLDLNPSEKINVNLDL